MTAKSRPGLIIPVAEMKKLKESGSISDFERLNFLSSCEIDADNILGSTEGPVIDLSGLKTPFKTQTTHETEVTISPPTPKSTSLNHDKVYYDDRCNDSIFDPLLARSSLPRIIVSIGGMLLTGFFLNIIIVHGNQIKIYFIFVGLEGV